MIVNLHNNFKIENQIKKSQSQNIKELGDFCIQSQYEKLCPSSSIHWRNIKGQNNQKVWKIKNDVIMITPTKDKIIKNLT